jgi:predicted ABC-type ATPase
MELALGTLKDDIILDRSLGRDPSRALFDILAGLEEIHKRVIFAGPNGAGKSTHADAILAALGIEIFVNADYIARGLFGRNTDAIAFEAGRIMLKRLRQLSDAKADFAFESTLSSRIFVAFFHALKRQGYVVAIYYFSLSNAQLAIRRVKLRVASGGHDVPTDMVRRRFGRSLNNFFRTFTSLWRTNGPCSIIPRRPMRGALPQGAAKSSGTIGQTGAKTGGCLWRHRAKHQAQARQESAQRWLI